VELGLVTSLSRPGGNITGISILDVELGPKRLQLLHEMVPTTKIISSAEKIAMPVTLVPGAEVNSGRAGECRPTRPAA
jgi:putative ABC transport system substrate-binding protein